MSATLRIAVFIAFVTFGNLARADIIVVGEFTTITSPTAETIVPLEFYLDLTDEDDGGSLSVGNYQIDLQLSGAQAGTDVRIVSVGPTTLRDQARTLDSTQFTDTTAFAGTINFADPFDINDGAGLLLVELAIAAGAQGEWQLSILDGADQTLFTDPNDFVTPIQFTSVPSVLTVSVPEPSTASLVSLLCLLNFACVRSKAQSSR